MSRHRRQRHRRERRSRLDWDRIFLVAYRRPDGFQTLTSYALDQNAVHVDVVVFGTDHPPLWNHPVPAGARFDVCPNAENAFRAAQARGGVWAHGFVVRRRARA